MIAEIGPVRKNPKATTRRSVNESANRLRVLLEQDLDQAETQLAAKSMVTDLQDMAEDVAKMQVETLMSLVERMKEVFGVEQATQFNTTVEGVLQATLQNLKDAHAQVSNAILTLTGEGEAASPMGGDMGAPEASLGEPEAGAEGMGGAEAASGPEEEATGREFK
jgi:ribosomal protein S25